MPFQEAKVTGAFDVKIVFTEKPHDFKIAHIAVDGGKASALVVGVPFTRLGDCTPTDDDEDPIGTAYSTLASTYQTPSVLRGCTDHDGDAYP